MNFDTKIRNMLYDDIAVMTMRDYIKLDIYKDENTFIISTMNTQPNYELYYEIGEQFLIEQGYKKVIEEIKLLYRNGCYVGYLHCTVTD